MAEFYHVTTRGRGSVDHRDDLREGRVHMPIDRSPGARDLTLISMTLSGHRAIVPGDLWVAPDRPVYVPEAETVTLRSDTATLATVVIPATHTPVSVSVAGFPTLEATSAPGVPVGEDMAPAGIAPTLSVGTLGLAASVAQQLRYGDSPTFIDDETFAVTVVSNPAVTQVTAGTTFTNNAWLEAPRLRRRDWATAIAAALEAKVDYGTQVYARVDAATGKVTLGVSSSKLDAPYLEVTGGSVMRAIGLSEQTRLRRSTSSPGVYEAVGSAPTRVRVAAVDHAEAVGDIADALSAEVAAPCVPRDTAPALVVNGTAVAPFPPGAYSPEHVADAVTAAVGTVAALSHLAITGTWDPSTRFLSIGSQSGTPFDLEVDELSARLMRVPAGKYIGVTEVVGTRPLPVTTQTHLVVKASATGRLSFQHQDTAVELEDAGAGKLGVVYDSKDALWPFVPGDVMLYRTTGDVLARAPVSDDVADLDLADRLTLPDGTLPILSAAPLAVGPVALSSDYHSATTDEERVLAHPALSERLGWPSGAVPVTGHDAPSEVGLTPPPIVFVTSPKARALPERGSAANDSILAILHNGTSIHATEGIIWSNQRAREHAARGTAMSSITLRFVLPDGTPVDMTNMTVDAEFRLQ